MRASVYWALLAGVLAAVYGSAIAWRQVDRGPQATGTQATGPQVALVSASAAPAVLVPFVLTDQFAQSFDSRSLDGKVWVGSFFFTNCPAVCRQLNQTLAGWQHQHPKSDVRFVSITCDPDNDTPAALAEYAKIFSADHARWTFLTGDMRLIQDIGQGMLRFSVDRGTHSDRAFIVDRQGIVRGRFRLTEPDQLQMLERLLDVIESEPLPIANAGPVGAAPPTGNAGPADAAPPPGEPGEPEPAPETQQTQQRPTIELPQSS